MRLFYKTLVFTFLITRVMVVTGQETSNLNDSLKKSHADTNRVKLLLQQAELYYFSKPDSCLTLAKQAIELSQKLNFQNGEFKGLSVAGEALRFLGDFPRALEMQFKALYISRSIRDKGSEAASLSFIGVIYEELSEYSQALSYFYQAKKIYDALSEPVMSTFNLSNIGNAYERINRLDSALYFQQQASEKAVAVAHKNLKVLVMTRLGIVHARLGKHQQALQYSYNALEDAYLIGSKVSASKIQSLIAELFLAIDHKDSSLHYARLAFATSKLASQKLQMLEASNLLVKLFRNKIPDSVIYYQEIAIAMNDSLYGAEKFRQLQLMALKEQELRREEEQYKQKRKILTLLVMLGFFLIIAAILFRNNRHKQKVNLLLQEQKKEIEKTITVLKSTQAQLIQSEKMASLGELTAGIAHEIQNPLNFVNNFSDLNTELIEEMKQELKTGNNQEGVAIANEVAENEQKINHHGKRADAIVKGMLQHSKASANQKELTDINKLADEYLRLGYHGHRAKDPSFKVAIHPDFDESIEKIKIIPQEIGRVILNLITNAFYAVAEKKKQQPDYEPVVSVITQRVSSPPISGIEVRVKDNGNGIPPKVLDKIFQPFFTTKPTGQGTGLGLSLSYDIVKAHGGELKVETKEGEGAEFIIQLPDRANIKGQ
ncbi:MAG: ATP-binding protein [Bacteroidota bacterium]|nr:ATP-binding protein [Bacteroidota bacterium]